MNNTEEFNKLSWRSLGIQVKSGRKERNLWRWNKKICHAQRHKRLYRPTQEMYHTCTQCKGHLQLMPFKQINTMHSLTVQLKLGLDDWQTFLKIKTLWKNKTTSTANLNKCQKLQTNSTKQKMSPTPLQPRTPVSPKPPTQILQTNYKNLHWPWRIFVNNSKKGDP